MTALQFGYFECLPRSNMAATILYMLISHPCFPKGPVSSMMRLPRILRRTRRLVWQKRTRRRWTIIARFVLRVRIVWRGTSASWCARTAGITWAALTTI